MVEVLLLEVDGLHGLRPCQTSYLCEEELGWKCQWGLCYSMENGIGQDTVARTKSLAAGGSSTQPYLEKLVCSLQLILSSC